LIRGQEIRGWRWFRLLHFGLISPRSRCGSKGSKADSRRCQRGCCAGKNSVYSGPCVVDLRQ
jgi:hypothetical protein